MEQAKGVVTVGASVLIGDLRVLCDTSPFRRVRMTEDLLHKAPRCCFTNAKKGDAIAIGKTDNTLLVQVIGSVIIDSIAILWPLMGRRKRLGGSASCKC